MLNIIEEPEVLADLEAAEPRFTRLWDAWNGLLWVIARTPNLGLTLDPGPPRWQLYKLDAAINGAPGFTVCYSYDRVAVTIRTVLIS